MGDKLLYTALCFYTVFVGLICWFLITENQDLQAQYRHCEFTKTSQLTGI